MTYNGPAATTDDLLHPKTIGTELSGMSSLENNPHLVSLVSIPKSNVRPRSGSKQPASSPQL